MKIKILNLINFYIEQFKNNILKIKKELKVLFFAYKRKDIGFLPKFFIVLTVSYALSPIDLIPDFIPIIGYLDDFIILPLLIFISIKLIPANILNECREKAENEKIELKKNWFAGILFISFWIFIFIVIIIKILKLIKVK